MKVKDTVLIKRTDKVPANMRGFIGIVTGVYKFQGDEYVDVKVGFNRKPARYASIPSVFVRKLGHIED